MSTYIFKIRDNNGTVNYGSDQVRNWADIENNLTRDQTYKGIVRSFTNTFEFVDEAKARFIQLLDQHGASAEMYMRIFVGNNNKDRSSFVPLADGQEFKAEFSDPDIDELTIKINFIDSGFESKLLSRDDTEVNFDTQTSIDGVIISDYSDKIKRVKLHDRTLFYDSTIEFTDNDFLQFLFNDLLFIPQYTIVESSDTDIKNTVNRITSRDIYSYRVEDFLILQAEEYKVYPLKWDFTINVNITANRNSDVGFFLVLKKVDVDFNLIEDIDIQIGTILAGTKTASFSYNLDTVIELNEGESFSMFFYCPDNTGAGTWNLSIEETISTNYTSYFESTESDIILPHELFSRLIEIYTGEENAFYSPIFGRTDLGYAEDGEWAYLGVCNGKMIRGFDFELNPFNTSLKDAFEAYNAVLNIGAYVEFEGNKPRFRIEKYIDLFDPNNILDLGSNVTGVKRKNNKDLLFTEINCGYKNQEYEEVNGLDSFNGEFTFSTPLVIKKKKYDIECKYRADDYGIEFARRKQFDISSTEDTRYDDDNYLIDCKLDLVGIVSVRSEDFTTVNNILEPQNAYNLRISPKRNLYRHGDIIKSGLIHIQSDSLIYVKGANNAELQTQLTTESELLIEKDNILIETLDNPIFLAELLDVECPFTKQQWDNLIKNKNKMLKFTYKKDNLYIFIDDFKYNIDEEKAVITGLRANR